MANYDPSDNIVFDRSAKRPRNLKLKEQSGKEKEFEQMMDANVK